MRLLHVNFHKGCELDIEYIFNKLGHEITSMRFDDGETDNFSREIYYLTHDRAQKSWDKYSDYYNSFDGIITSDTCPLSRVFLQNNWSKLLIIWVCNRFDYSMPDENQDREFYQLLRDIPNRPNVYIFGYTRIENIYATQFRNVNIGDFNINPLGKNLISENMYKTYDNNSEIFYVPTYHNETKLMNLSEKLTSLGIQNKCERFKHISDLLKYKAGIYMPYAWSTIVLFERIQLGLVTFIPTIRFLLELFKTHGNGWFQPPYHHFQPDQMKNEILKLSEWYWDDHKDIFVFFDSWSDLVRKVKTTNYEQMTKKILNFAKKHEEDTFQRWKHVIDDYTAKLSRKNINYFEEYLTPREQETLNKYSHVIIWGFPLNTHTHSYIHAMWVKVFKEGFNKSTHWFDDQNYPKDFDYSNCIFITEGYADNNIPIVEGSVYFVHNAINPEKYITKKARLIEIRFNVDEIHDVNNDFNLNDGTHNEITFLSNETKYEKLYSNKDIHPSKRGNKVVQMNYECVYLYWATDLLPHEFNFIDVYIEKYNCIYYIGSPVNSVNLHIFINECNKRNIEFKFFNPWETPLTFEQNRILMKNSLLSPDFRPTGTKEDEMVYGIKNGKNHMEIGYLPCRVLKSISYGQLGMTDSPHVKKILGEHVVYNKNMSKLLDFSLNERKNYPKIIESMKYVQENHTYVHRARDLIRAIIH